MPRFNVHYSLDKNPYRELIIAHNPDKAREHVRISNERFTKNGAVLVIKKVKRAKG